MLQNRKLKPAIDCSNMTTVEGHQQCQISRTGHLTCTTTAVPITNQYSMLLHMSEEDDNKDQDYYDTRDTNICAINPTHGVNTTMGIYVYIYSDGASRGNPGESSYGYVIKSHDLQKTIHSHGARIGVASNNVAEYNGLIAGLEYCLASDYLYVRCRADSKLMVDQLNSKQSVNKQELIPLYRRVIEQLKPKFKSLMFQHVPRSENSEADAMCNEAFGSQPDDPPRIACAVCNKHHNISRDGSMRKHKKCPHPVPKSLIQTRPIRPPNDPQVRSIPSSLVPVAPFDPGSCHLLRMRYGVRTLRTLDAPLYLLVSIPCRQLFIQLQNMHLRPVDDQHRFQPYSTLLDQIIMFPATHLAIGSNVFINNSQEIHESSFASSNDVGDFDVSDSLVSDPASFDVLADVPLIPEWGGSSLRFKHMHASGLSPNVLRQLKSNGIADVSDPVVREAIVRTFPPAPEGDFPELPTSAIHHVSLDRTKLIRAARAMHRDSAPGASGWTADAICALIMDDLCYPGFEKLILDIINGDVPDDRRQYFVDTSFIGLVKDPQQKAAVRPIQMFEVFTKIATEYLTDEIGGQKMSQMLGMFQFGGSSGSANGVDVCFHRIQSVIERYADEGHVQTFYDFVNAFNAVNVNKVAECVFAEPDLRAAWKFIHFVLKAPNTAHASASFSFIRYTGLPQGWNFSPFLFSLTVRSLYEASFAGLVSITPSSYLDDFMVDGSPDDNIVVSQRLQDNGPEFGLTLNWPKCASFSPLPGPPSADAKRIGDMFGMDTKSGAMKHLGSVVGMDQIKRHEIVANIISDSLEKNAKALLRTEIPVQVFFDLLRRCVIPAVNYIMTTIPPHLIASTIRSFDERVLDVVASKFLLSKSEVRRVVPYWFITLPRDYGGIGVVRQSDSILASYLTGFARAMEHSIPSELLVLRSGTYIPGLVAALDTMRSICSLDDSVHALASFDSDRDRLSFSFPVYSESKRTTVILPSVSRAYVQLKVQKILYNRFRGTDPPPLPPNLDPQIQHTDEELSIHHAETAAHREYMFLHNLLQSFRGSSAARLFGIVPSTRLKRISDSSMRAACRFLFRLYPDSVVGFPDVCRCGDPTSPDHNQSCILLRRTLVTDRHDNINRLLRYFATQAGVSFCLEGRSVDEESEKRPDYQFDFHFGDGDELGDGVCIHTAADSHVNFIPMEEVMKAEDLKTGKYSGYAGIPDGQLFTPFATSSFGVFGPSARQFIKRLAAARVANFLSNDPLHQYAYDFFIRFYESEIMDSILISIHTSNATISCGKKKTIGWNGRTSHTLHSAA